MVLLWTWQSLLVVAWSEKLLSLLLLTRLLPAPMHGMRRVNHALAPTLTGEAISHLNGCQTTEGQKMVPQSVSEGHIQEDVYLK